MDLRDASLGFYRVWMVATGARHDLFRPLARWRGVSALARERGLHAPSLARWCDAAWALSLLERDGARYRVPPSLVDRLARPGTALDLSGHATYLARKSLGFGDLDRLLRTGRAPARPLARTYEIATRWDHVAFFDLLLPRSRALAGSLRRGIDVLDLGAGAGGWTREAAQRFPASRFVAADVDAREVRRARSTLRGLRNATARAASALPEEAFDLVFLGEVLASADEPARVLANAREALRPGGRLVALEGLRPPAGKPPRGWGERLVLAMDFDFGLDGSRFLRVDEARGLLARAGFRRASLRDLGGSLFALCATRPRASNGAPRISGR